jgi:hypothetical protein
VLHGFISNYDSVPAGDALLLAGEYIVITLVIAFLSWLFYRDVFKASLFALLIMSYQFFFSNLLDLLKSQFAASFLLRYRFLLPFSLIFFAAIFIWLKRKKKLPPALISYLNILFLVVILFDTGRLIVKIPAINKKKAFHPTAEGFSICDSCSKPDIFLIIPDQYTGNSALKEIFQFDNSRFEDELKLRGFHISEKSSSNYNYTPFSVASTLNMNLLSLQKGQQTYKTVQYSYDIIRSSLVLKFLAASGYRFYNCSIFDFDSQPAHKYAAFLPYGISLITSQTFTGRLSDDFRQDVLEGKLHFRELRKKIAYENLSFNDNILDLTVKTARQKSPAPKFVYTHLMMPHYPYYFDSTGNPLPLEKLTDRKKVNSDDYIGYLVYSNKKLLQLVDNILTSSTSPPIIIVLSDHGLRHPEKDNDPAYDFINLNAVYFPNKNYSLFYDSITNLNEFRVIFNSYFHQHLPLLKDSTTSLRGD